MKELRPGSTGRSEIRVLFVFDSERMAILLVGGDKSDNWTAWYDQNMPIAHDRFEQHQGRSTNGGVGPFSTAAIHPIRARVRRRNVPWMLP